MYTFAIENVFLPLKKVFKCFKYDWFVAIIRYR